MSTHGANNHLACQDKENAVRQDLMTALRALGNANGQIAVLEEQNSTLLYEVQKLRDALALANEKNHELMAK